MQREHMVHSSLLTSEPHIVVIGAGGNGSAMLASLATLNHAMRELGHPGFRVTAVDGDTVSPSNVGRQGFYPCDVGQFKTDVLIQRINMGFGTRWASTPAMFTGEDSGDLHADMVISCVDSRRVRASAGEAAPGSAPVRRADRVRRQVPPGSPAARDLSPRFPSQSGQD